MNYSTQIPMRKLCFILSLLSVAFTIVSSYLFMKPNSVFHESKITVRFWIVTIVLAAITIITLKIR